MTRTCFIPIAGVIALTTGAAAQRDSEPTGPNFHKLLVIDSVQIGGIGLPRNGRWMTFTRGGTIWVVPVDGRAKPARLLSAGYTDRNPTWFPSGDRLAFVSNRASRNGSNRFYGMTVGIDPNTGKALGTPRQITTEEVLVLGGPSPDEKWIPYITPTLNVIRIIPATGGTARTLVTRDRVRAPIQWTSDGKAVLFPVGGSNEPPYGVWHRISFNGGALTRAFRDSMAMPHMSGSDSYVVVTPTTSNGRLIKRVELFEPSGRLAGTAELPNAMLPSFPKGAVNGLYGVMIDTRYEAHLVTLSDRRRRVEPADTRVWVDGWTSDGVGMLIDGSGVGNLFIGVLDTTGRMLHRVALPADARSMGWGGVVGYATTSRRGPRPHTPDAPTPLYVANARSGTVRELTPRALETMNTSMRISGRGGADQDGDRFLALAPNGAMTELWGFTMDGRSTLLRAFRTADSVIAAAVHGDRVAWVVPSRDSVIVYTSHGASAPARRLTALRKGGGRWLEIGWSHDGSALALAGGVIGQAIPVLRVDAAGALREPVLYLNPRAEGPWCLRWSTDDRAILVIATPAGAPEDAIVRVPLNTAEAATVIASGDGVSDDNFYLSPDGRQIAFPVQRTLGTSVWRIDFVPPGGRANPRDDSRR
jgi:hypothetical protein